MHELSKYIQQQGRTNDSRTNNAQIKRPQGRSSSITAMKDHRQRDQAKTHKERGETENGNIPPRRPSRPNIREAYDDPFVEPDKPCDPSPASPLKPTTESLYSTNDRPPICCDKMMKRQNMENSTFLPRKRTTPSTITLSNFLRKQIYPLSSSLRRNGPH